MSEISIPLRSIKIHTRSMPNLSWWDILGKRKELKERIRSEVRSNADLYSLWSEGKRLDINHLQIEKSENVGDPVLVSGFGNRHDDYAQETTATREIVGFTYGNQYYPFSQPMMIDQYLVSS